MPGSTLQDADGPEALGWKPSSDEPAEKFPQDQMESMTEAVRSQLVLTKEDSAVSQQSGQNLGGLARGLVSVIVEGALVEVERHVSGRQPWTSTSEEARLPLTDQADTEMETQSSDLSCPSAAVQSGLPAVGSLDYPDAPPTTPLLLELEGSRDSFTRKLKGGLAKVFLPSPPPPTPLDGQDHLASAQMDSQDLLVEHLMRSLPRNDPVGLDWADGGDLEGNVEVFAETLSGSIINSPLRTTI